MRGIYKLNIDCGRMGSWEGFLWIHQNEYRL